MCRGLSFCSLVTENRNRFLISLGGKLFSPFVHRHKRENKPSSIKCNCNICFMACRFQTDFLLLTKANSARYRFKLVVMGFLQVLSKWNMNGKITSFLRVSLHFFGTSVSRREITELKAWSAASFSLSCRLDTGVQASGATKEDACVKHCNPSHCCHRKLLITSTLADKGRNRQARREKLWGGGELWLKESSGKKQSLTSWTHTLEYPFYRFC